MKTLGQWLKERRQRKGWSQERLAKAMIPRKSKYHISKVENDKLIPSSDTLFEYCNILGCSFLEAELIAGRIPGKFRKLLFHKSANVLRFLKKLNRETFKPQDNPPSVTKVSGLA